MMVRILLALSLLLTPAFAWAQAHDASVGDHQLHYYDAVSYTHLTLPTICSV